MMKRESMNDDKSCVYSSVDCARRLDEKTQAIVASKGRSRPGLRCGVRTVRTAYGDSVHRIIPEWCSYFMQNPVKDDNFGRPLHNIITVLSCDRIMKDSALDPKARCRYTDCIRIGCDHCGGPYKNIGGYMKMRRRFREAERYLLLPRHDRNLIWSRRIEPYLFDGWRITKNLTADD